MCMGFGCAVFFQCIKQKTENNILLCLLRYISAYIHLLGEKQKTAISSCFCCSMYVRRTQEMSQISRDKVPWHAR